MTVSLGKYTLVLSSHSHLQSLFQLSQVSTLLLMILLPCWCCYPTQSGPINFINIDITSVTNPLIHINDQWWSTHLARFHISPVTSMYIAACHCPSSPPIKASTTSRWWKKPEATHQRTAVGTFDAHQWLPRRPRPAKEGTRIPKNQKKSARVHLQRTGM